MEEELLALPLEGEALRYNFFQKIIKKLLLYIKKLIRRIIDIIGAILGIISLIPLTIVVYVQNIRNKDYGPVFYVQERIGKNGKIFKMYKFRTMAVGAEEKLKQILEQDGEAREEFKKYKKIKNDPRVTKFGHFLRRTSLDEFPQFINVLKGEMTLVGPRPYLPSEIEDMGDYYNYIIKYKPGLTGIYQIAGSERVEFLDRLDMDIRYHHKRNFLLDVKIALITMFVTLRRKETYNVGNVTLNTLGYISKMLTFSIKRIIDIIGAIVGMIIMIPLTITVFIGNRICKDKGPLFYTQERIGKDGKIFKIYKYRSMVVGAEEILEEMLKNDKEARKEYKKYKKLKHDPRITKMGNFLRKTSLDEFPQFINVLKGEMSIVGPRAYMVTERPDMGDAYNTIIECKPGITGLWQVSGRSDVSFEKRLNMDIEYYENYNLLMDAEILLKTFSAVLNKEGAA